MARGPLQAILTFKRARPSHLARTSAVPITSRKALTSGAARRRQSALPIGRALECTVRCHRSCPLNQPAAAGGAAATCLQQLAVYHSLPALLLYIRPPPPPPTCSSRVTRTSASYVACPPDPAPWRQPALRLRRHRRRHGPTAPKARSCSRSRLLCMPVGEAGVERWLHG